MIIDAGQSKRMQSVYPGIPKALIQSKEGHCILGHQLSVLNRFSDYIDEVLIVIGYEQNQFREFMISSSLQIRQKVTFLVNEDYASTDNAYSIHIALNHNKNETSFIFLDGDIVFTSDLFNLLMHDMNENTLIGRPCELTSEDAKVRLVEGYVIGVGKQISGEYAYGSMIKIGGSLLEDFRNEISSAKWWKTWYSAPLTELLKVDTRSMKMVQAPPNTSMDVDTPDELEVAFAFMAEKRA